MSSQTQVDAAGAPAIPLTASFRPRLDSIDFLRGLVMVIMALDHTRGFFTNVPFYPLDLGQTTPALFMTRWITHFCAPVFVFLAGTGAFLSSTRGKSSKELSVFLLTRGLWLVLLEITVIRWFGWTFNFDMTQVGIGVIWAIGWSMVILAGLVFLPTRAVGIVGLALIGGHNAFDSVSPSDLGSFAWLWHVLHTPGPIHYMPGYTLHIGYPLVPWAGVMAAGFAFGKLMLIQPEERLRWLLRLGIAGVALFLVLRIPNIYGDPHAWTPQKNALFSLFAMLHCQKYPPSLLYLLMTLGPALLLLALVNRGVPELFKPLILIGRVPLFYYLLHLPLIHGLAMLLAVVRHGRADFLYGNAPGPRPSDYGYDLPVVYLMWFVVVLILYPACRWFADLKRRRKDAWLSYL